MALRAQGCAWRETLAGQAGLLRHDAATLFGLTVAHLFLCFCLSASCRGAYARVPLTPQAPSAWIAERQGRRFASLGQRLLQPRLLFIANRGGCSGTYAERTRAAAGLTVALLTSLLSSACCSTVGVASPPRLPRPLPVLRRTILRAKTRGPSGGTLKPPLYLCGLHTEYNMRMGRGDGEGTTFCYPSGTSAGHCDL